jgi:hypothetical protein
MKLRTPGRGLAAIAVWLVAGVALAADEPVPALQDLMGAKGASVEMSMTRRGYEYVGRGPGARSDFEYWREGKTRACVAVRYRDNRVTAVLRGAEPDCAAAAANKPSAPAPTATGFSTVCGVTVDGKPYRYNCTVEGVAPGGPGKTTLHFPDNKVTLEWRGAGKASATFEGMNPRDVDVTTSEGTTQFLLEGKPYFWVSDRRAAEAELKSLK